MVFLIKMNGLAGAQGFEPRMTGPEPVALPLGDAPTIHRLFYQNLNKPTITLHTI